MELERSGESVESGGGVGWGAHGTKKNALVFVAQRGERRRTTTVSQILPCLYLLCLWLLSACEPT